MLKNVVPNVFFFASNSLINTTEVFIFVMIVSDFTQTDILLKSIIIQIMT